MESIAVPTRLPRATGLGILAGIFSPTDPPAPSAHRERGEGKGRVGNGEGWNGERGKGGKGGPPGVHFIRTKNCD